MNVGFISLGCSKNLIDTEMTIGLFKKNNYKINTLQHIFPFLPLLFPFKD